MSDSPQSISVLLLSGDQALIDRVRVCLDGGFHLRVARRLSGRGGADVILLDASLEGADRLANRLRAQPVVVLFDPDRYAPRGADEVLRKPPDRESLRRRIKSVLAVDKLRQDRLQALRELDQARRREADLERGLQEARQQVEALSSELVSTRGRNFEFLRQSVHELRNPLNAILGFARLLLRKAGPALDERSCRNLEQIQTSAQQLKVLIDDMLELERLRADQVRLVLEPIDSSELALELQARHQEAADRKGLRLETRVVDAPLHLRTDRSRLELVLDQLLRNALDYSGQGTVRLSFERRPPGIRISVSDQGPGIPEEDQEAVFEPYVRGAGLDSAGLGLALARRTAAALGGRLDLASRPDEGSTFTLTLGQSALLERVCLEPVGEGPVVLLVDDEVSVLEVLRSVLSEAGYRVHAVNSGEQGLELAVRLKPAVVVVDVVMPGIGGLEIAREMARNPETAAIPVIVWSGVDERPDETEVQVAAWLTKPFDFDEVQRLVDELAKRPR